MGRGNGTVSLYRLVVRQARVRGDRDEIGRAARDGGHREERLGAVWRYCRRIDSMTTGSFGTVLVTGVPAILSTTAVPSITRPKTA